MTRGGRLTPSSVKIKVECELGAAGQCIWGTGSNYAWVLGVQEGPTWTKQREDTTPLNTHAPECPQLLFLPRFLLGRVEGLPCTCHQHTRVQLHC